MDYSEYLRYKKASMPTTIARQTCMDASLRTYILSKAANTTSNTQNSTFTKKACCPGIAPEAAIGYRTNTTEASKLPETERAICCSTFQDRYTAPFIEKPGCPVPYMSTTYLSPKCEPCYQGTRFDKFKPEQAFRCTSNCGPKY